MLSYCYDKLQAIFLKLHQVGAHFFATSTYGKCQVIECGARAD